MATITLRSVKGSPLTNTEVDNNFTNLNDELVVKIDLTDLSGSGDITYNNTTGEISFNNSSGFITSYTETDPIVGAITGIVKADGAGNISAAIAGTDYLTSYTETSTLDDVVGRGATTTTDVSINAELTAQSYNETLGTITASDLDLETGNVFEETISANTTYTFSNPPASGTAYGFTLKVSVTGTRTITWPTSVEWAGGTAPDAPADGETDVYAFYTTDGGTTYYGFQAGDAMA